MSAHGDRIQIRFTWKGKELRPTLGMKPNARNLAHAARVRSNILDDIKLDRLDLERYFPGYRFMRKHQADPVTSTFTEVKVLFVAWVKTRQKDSSVKSLARKIKSFWEPTFGERDIRSITFKELSKHVADRVWGSDKTHNNYVSALREMFAYALDHEYIGENPTLKLKMLQVQTDEPTPYSVAEAEALIAQARKRYGEIDAIYWHLAFLFGWRPGEAISVMWTDWNRITGRITIQRNRTEGVDSKKTKTSKVRHIDPPPAAVKLLNDLRALTALRGPFMFIDHETGAQIDRSTIMQERWVVIHKKAGVDYREPYQCRHSSVSWKLMAGRNPFKISNEHGHSMATMYKTYAHWIDTESDQAEIERIRAFHGWQDSGVATERRSG